MLELRGWKRIDIRRTPLQLAVSSVTFTKVGSKTEQTVNPGDEVRKEKEVRSTRLIVGVKRRVD